MDVLSLNDFANVPDVIEDGASFFENALKKAKAISEHTGEIVLADDSGLEVEYLNGQPGVYSSRYSGEGATDDTNIEEAPSEYERRSSREKGCGLPMHTGPLLSGRQV